jgi:hypothetical protein
VTIVSRARGRSARGSRVGDLNAGPPSESKPGRSWSGGLTCGSPSFADRWCPVDSPLSAAFLCPRRGPVASGPVWSRIPGRIGGRFIAGSPILLLTTTGRTTGKQRTRPLAYVPDEDR